MADRLAMHYYTELAVGDAVILTDVGMLAKPGVRLARGKREQQQYLGMAGVITDIKINSIGVASVLLSLDEKSKPGRIDRTIRTYAERFTKIGMSYRDYLFVWGEENAT